jgi:hypothetical protein
MLAFTSAYFSESGLFKGLRGQTLNKFAFLAHILVWVVREGSLRQYPTVLSLSFKLRPRQRRGEDAAIGPAVINTAKFPSFGKELQVKVSVADDMSGLGSARTVR